MPSILKGDKEEIESQLAQEKNTTQPHPLMLDWIPAQAKNCAFTDHLGDDIYKLKWPGWKKEYEIK